MKVIDSETRWAKLGDINTISCIGKDILMYAKGCHLFFKNLTNNEELIYTANTARTGDGIQCFTGHRSQSVFTFAEKRTQAAIFVKTYPNFDEICTLRDNTTGWLELVFSETSLLISAGDVPDFVITVWNWRRGEKIATQNGGIQMREQFLKCNYGSPVLLAQLGINSDKLHLWDIFVCGKKSILTEHEITIETKFVNYSRILWTGENALLVIDTQGCIYTTFPDHHLEKIIDCNEEGNQTTNFVWYKGGIVVYGPNIEIRHYKKSGTWTIDWTIQPIEPIKKLFARYEHLLAATENNNILEILPNQNECKYIKEKESSFNNFCIIHPTGEYLMVLSYGNLLNLFKVETGERMSSLDLNQTANTITENPKFPYAALGFDNGCVKLFSAYNPEKLTQLTSFYLTKDPINSIIFNDSGTVLVASNLTYGRLFIIEGLPGGNMKILATIDVKNQIVDLMMILSENCYRIFLIPLTSENFLAGNVIWRYCIIQNKSVDVKEYSFNEKNVWFNKIIAISGHNRHRQFYLVSFTGKSIDEVQIEKGDIVAKITKKNVTGHQLCGVNFKLTKTVALTWSCDGFIIARSPDFLQNIGICLPHHRFEAGVKKAQIDPHHKYIISLGRDNVLVCTNLMQNQINLEFKQELENLHNSSDYKLLFTRHTIGFQPKGKYEGKCYLEYEELKKTETERILCELEKKAILEEFKIIQEELQALLTKNLDGPDNEKLELSEFNLNTKLYEEQTERHKILRKATEIYLKNIIEEQNKVTNFMMDFFWNKMLIHGRAIKGIFQRFEVTNYVLRPPNPDRESRLEFIKHLRTLEQYLSEMKPFHPWEPMPEDKLLALVNSRPLLPLKDQHLQVLSALELDAPEVEEEDEDLETKIAFSGSDVCRFIELDDIHYPQDEVQTYMQTEIQWIIAKNNCYKLKEFFNEKFDKIMMQKVKEIDNILQKNARLRHIVSELNYFSEEKIFITIDDPEWRQIENPDLLTQVKDNEVPITPYISPSEQAILDAKAAEEERIRLLLLADDFRERALMAMMNGVLEIRWEDELKKDVPLPKCMIEKQPENYNEEDLKAVRDYEEKVKFLNSERERYKFLLRSDYIKVSRHVRENIKKFNNKLNDLLKLKLAVDSGLSHESLKINRTKLFQKKRINLIRKEQEVLQKIIKNDEIVASLQKLMHTLHDSVFELRSYVDSYQPKEKFLERAYKKDFQDLSIVIQEQASKLYKKRPKINLRSINSATLLNELSKHILSTSKPPLSLTNDCLEFLKQLDMLDMYVGVPSVIDEHIYSLICKHRRLKIEYEVKLKAAQTELAEAETTTSAFQKRLHQKKEFSAKLNHKLTEIREELLNDICDIDMQIVLPLGLVEVDLSGRLQDFKDAVLICRDDVEKINKIILEFGDKKIKALQRAMTFRRKILRLEWEHKRMKMLIQDLEEKLVDIEHVKLTKELQFHLKSKDKDKAIPFEIEVDMIKASYENTIQDRKDKVNRMKKQIKAIKAHDEATEKKIQEINVDVCEYNLTRDKELDERERNVMDTRMKTLLQRSKLVKCIQDNHHEILMLQTELELLRLKTFPTLKYKTV